MNTASHSRLVSFICSIAGGSPRSSDGQLLFLMEMVDKIRPLATSPQDSRIASVHNGSSLFCRNGTREQGHAYHD